MSNETSVPQQEMSPTAWLRDFAQRYEAGTLKDVKADVSVLQKIANALDAARLTPTQPKEVNDGRP